MTEHPDETKLIIRELTEMCFRMRQAGIGARFFCEALIEFGEGGLRAVREHEAARGLQ